MNPFHFHAASNWVCFGIALPMYKAVEFQVSKWEGSRWFWVNFWYRDRSQDHTGIDIDITILKIEFRFTFYDCRHLEYYRETINE